MWFLSWVILKRWSAKCVKPWRLAGRAQGWMWRVEAVNVEGDSRVNFLLLLIALSDAYRNRSTFRLKIWWGFFFFWVFLHRADYGFASVVCLPVCLAVREITQKWWFDDWQWERNRWLSYGEVQNNPILYYGWDRLNPCRKCINPLYLTQVVPTVNSNPRPFLYILIKRSAKNNARIQWMSSPRRNTSDKRHVFRGRFWKVSRSYLIWRGWGRERKADQKIEYLESEG